MTKLESITSKKRQDSILRALEFSSQNPNVLIMMADPTTDDVLAIYNSKYSAARIKSKLLKRKMDLIKEIVEGKTKGKQLNKAIYTFCHFVEEFLFKFNEQMVENSQVKK